MLMRPCSVRFVRISVSFQADGAWEAQVDTRNSNEASSRSVPNVSRMNGPAGGEGR